MRVRLFVKMLVVNVALFAAALYVVEGALWFMERKEPAQYTPPFFGYPTKFELVRDLRRRGEYAFPSVHPRQFLQHPLWVAGRAVLPLSGIANARTVYCNESGAYLVFDSDEWGFNNPQGTRSKPVEIALIGDSFVQGACVPVGTGFGDLLRKARGAVYNTGMGGNGPLLEYAAFKEFVAPLKPKMVFWFYFEGNDPAELAGEWRAPVLLRYLDEGFTQNLAGVAADVDLALQEYVNQRFADLLAGRAEVNPAHPRASFVRLERLSSRFETLTRRALKLDERRLEQIWTLTKQKTESWGGRLVVVYLPSWQRYVDPSQTRQLRDVEVTARRVATKLGLDYVDIPARFERNENPEKLYYQHFNEEGNRVVADALVEYLNAQPTAQGR